MTVSIQHARDILQQAELLYSHEQVQAGAGGEIQLTDGISALMQEERMIAYRFSGTRYDCGSKLGYLKAMVALGLKHPEVDVEFAAYLKSLK